MCTCIEKINEKLLAVGKNTKITVPIVFSFNGKESPDTVLIATEKADKSKKEKPSLITPTYCPFCGKKYSDMTQTNIEQDRIDFETIKTLTLKPYLTLMMNLGGAGNYDDLDKFKRDSFWEKTHEKAAEAIAELCIGLASQINISNKLREKLSNNQAAVKLTRERQASS